MILELVSLGLLRPEKNGQDIDRPYLVLCNLRCQSYIFGLVQSRFALKNTQSFGR